MFELAQGNHAAVVIENSVPRTTEEEDEGISTHSESQLVAAVEGLPPERERLDTKSQDESDTDEETQAQSMEEGENQVDEKSLSDGSRIHHEDQPDEVETLPFEQDVRNDSQGLYSGGDHLAEEQWTQEEKDIEVEGEKMMLSLVEGWLKEGQHMPREEEQPATILRGQVEPKCPVERDRSNLDQTTCISDEELFEEDEEKENRAMEKAILNPRENMGSKLCSVVEPDRTAVGDEVTLGRKENHPESSIGEGRIGTTQLTQLLVASRRSARSRAYVFSLSLISTILLLMYLRLPRTL